MINTRTFVYNLHFHLVFVTKYRQIIFDTAEKQAELKSLITKLYKGHLWITRWS